MKRPPSEQHLDRDKVKGPAVDGQEPHAGRDAPAGNDTAQPTVSVIIPTRASGATIRGCVEALANQDYEGPIEIVIAEADDPSEIETLTADIHPDVKVIHNPAKLCVSGIQLAIAGSRGQYLVRCDAHVFLAPNYISTALATLQRTGASNVGGRQIAEGRTFAQRGIAMALNSFAGAGDAVHRQRHSKEGPVDTAYLGTFDRERLAEVGGYAPRYIRNEDYELNYRLRTKGHVVWHDPNLEAYYLVRPSLPKLAQQYFKYGRSKSRLVLDFPKSIKPRHLAAPLLVLGFMTSFVMWILGQAWPVLALAALYGSFVLASSAAGFLRHRDAAALALPAVLPAIHLSWGLGFFFPARALASKTS